MEYRLGKSLKIKEKGQTVILQCPSCNDEVKFSVFTNLDTNIIPKFPIISNKDIYFLICPNCASVFGIDDINNKRLKKGQPLSIESSDLKELNKF